MTDKSYKTCAAENAARKQDRKYPPAEVSTASESDEVVELEPEFEPEVEPESEAEEETE